MRKLLGVAFLGASLLGAACGPEIDLAERSAYTNGSNTITILAYDATTGVPLNDATVKFMAGVYELPVVKNGNANVVAQVPRGEHLATVEAPGYLPFVGQADAQDCDGPTNNGYEQCFYTYQAALYPATGVTENVVVKVFEQESGAPVTAGQVLARLDSTNDPASTQFPNPLPGNFTLRPNTVVGTLGADGTATFPKEQLILGASYDVVVYGARSATGAPLEPSFSGTSFAAGASLPVLTVYLQAPGDEPVALSTNTETAGGIDPTLIVKFPYAVEVCSQTASHDFQLVDTTNTAVKNMANPVTVALSTDGQQLTLTPNFTSVNLSSGTVSAQLTGVQVKVRGSSACVNLASVKVRDGVTVDTRITLAGGLL